MSCLKAGELKSMKHTACQLIVLVSAILLCALAAPVSGQSAAPAAVPAAVPAVKAGVEQLTAKFPLY